MCTHSRGRGSEGVDWARIQGESSNYVLDPFLGYQTPLITLLDDNVIVMYNVMYTLISLLTIKKSSWKKKKKNGYQTPMVGMLFWTRFQTFSLT